MALIAVVIVRFLACDTRLHQEAFQEKGNSVDWINLAQDRDQWRALVNKVMELRFPEKAGNFLIS
jgi:hypothetical protein